MCTGKLEGKRPLLLFPEGMTSNGTHILPFKSGAFLAGVPVKPVVLRYGKVGWRFRVGICVLGLSRVYLCGELSCYSWLLCCGLWKVGLNV